MSDWRYRIESVAIGLLTLEVNTIRKYGMSAQKMPEVPIALHTIVECYADYLAEWGYGITQPLLELSAKWIDPPNSGSADDWQTKLIAWKPEQAPLDFTALTNGARTFQALRWAAAAALRDDNVIRVGPHPEHAMPDEVRAVIARITSNCRQISPLVLNLERIVAATTKPTDAIAKLFDGTLEQTAQALFSSKSPAMQVPIDTTVLVRKAWDVGTETVLLQTSMQIDGDVITRISPSIEDAQREFFLTLHNASVQIGLGQWKALFELMKALVGELGTMLFGGARS